MHVSKSAEEHFDADANVLNAVGDVVGGEVPVQDVTKIQWRKRVTHCVSKRSRAPAFCRVTTITSCQKERKMMLLMAQNFGMGLKGCSFSEVMTYTRTSVYMATVTLARLMMLIQTKPNRGSRLPGQSTLVICASTAAKVVMGRMMTYCRQPRLHQVYLEGR